MTNFNNSYIGLRPDLLKHIKGKNNTILDIGCATGSNGRHLLEHNIAQKIIGVEYDKEMAELSSQFYDKVYTGDLNDEEFIKNICETSEKVDYIIFGDVLEHLMDSRAVLRHLCTLLKENGEIIISVPNISHIELFIQVYIRGTWPRNERGIFDKTHVTWFTKKDVYEMVESAGLQIKTYDYNLRARDALGSKFNLLLKVLKFINKNLFIFQHIIVAKKNTPK